MTVAQNPPGATLEEVRERLRAHGYLDSGIERVIFSAPRASGAVVPSVLAGAVAFATASAAAVASRGAAAPAAGVLLVFLALLAVELPLAASAGAGLTVLSRAVRVPENPNRAATIAAAAAAAAVFLVFSVGARRLSAAARSHPIVALVPVCVTAFYFARAVRATTLSLWLRRHVSLPEAPGFRRGSAAALILALALSSATAWRESRESRFPAIAVRFPQKPLVVVGLDGVAPQTLALLAPGAPRVSWGRKLGPPPEVWSTLATGVSPARHGVAAFERASLFGSVAVRPPAFTAWIFRGPLRWIGASGRLPVSGAERRAYAVWEVASRLGIASAAVNWWASEGVPGAVVVSNAEIAAQSSSGAQDDRVAIARFRAARLRTRPVLAVLYLPGADIDRGALSNAARQFVDEEIRGARAGEENLWLVADAGRSGNAGAAAFFDSEARVPNEGMVRGEDLAPTILARLGIPAAADLDGAPLFMAFAPGALERRKVPTYGSRSSREPIGAESDSGREYLIKLKSLGYLK